MLFQNVFVDDESLVENSVLFDNVKVGRRVNLNKCIIDKHVVIPDGEVIGYDLAEDRKRFTVTEEGIVVIPQGYRFGDSEDVRGQFTENKQSVAK